jgi:hypothetical protein
MMREKEGDTDMMTPVQGLHGILQWGLAESSRIFVVD